MISISLIYLIDYFSNDKYIIEYSTYLNAADKSSISPFSYWEMKNKEVSDINPIVNISFNLFTVNESNHTSLSERFILLDAFTLEKLERNTSYQRKASEIGVIINYLCEDENCTLNEEDFTTFDYYIEMTYNGFELNHTSKIPLKNNSDIFFKNFFFFSFAQTKIQYLNWEAIKYKEEKGISRIFDKLMGRKNEYSSGFISPSEFTYIGKPIISQKYITNINTKVLAQYLMMKGLRQYSEYKRIKLSILDVLASIGALYSTLFTCFTFIFKYYSKNFDNYKIIQKIVNPKINFTKKEKKLKNIELNEIPQNSSDNNISNENKENPLINSQKDFIINDTDFDAIEKEINKDFKKLTFAQFFLNNFYCKNFNKFNEQEIIRICNEILSNYISIESILYNQILLENFFKDYKWNNQELNNIDNNEMLINLKKHL